MSWPLQSLTTSNCVPSCMCNLPSRLSLIRITASSDQIRASVDREDLYRRSVSRALAYLSLLRRRLTVSRVRGRIKAVYLKCNCTLRRCISFISPLKQNARFLFLSVGRARASCAGVAMAEVVGYRRRLDGRGICAKL